MEWNAAVKNTSNPLIFKWNSLQDYMVVVKNKDTKTKLH